MWKVCVPVLQKVFEENIAGLFCQVTARTNIAKTGRYLDTCMMVEHLNNFPPQQKKATPLPNASPRTHA